VTIRVLVADDQEMVRTGFRMILAAETDIEVVADARNGQEAVESTRRHRPDVVLMDIRMPVLDGLAAPSAILGDAAGKSRVLILTTFDDDQYVYEALAAGASAFLLKDAPADRLVEAIRVVAAGESILDPAVTRRVIERFARHGAHSEEARAVAALSARERDVLLLMARGLSNAEIAARLYLGEATVKTHVGRILLKLGARDRVQAVITAFRSGFAYETPPDR
jgi:DNA-binding NarL/FixJ family response regulator